MPIEGAGWQEDGELRLDTDPLPQRDLDAQKSVLRWRLRIRQDGEAHDTRGRLATKYL